VQAPDPARVASASVTFEPGARTAWHNHPLGQTLIVTFEKGVAIHEQLGGKTVEWMEKVSDEQYGSQQ
jgi:quercetin dioxygenase-like cupin family protein